MATLAEVLRQAGYVTPQGQVVGPRTTTAQTMSNYIRNIIPNAAQNLAQQRSDIDAALTMGDQGIQVGDRAAFERQMAQVPNLMGLTAYHGTPHTIKGKFDISKVGTGEGAQAYGHGMYFAENPAVAKEYSKMMPVGGAQPSPRRTLGGIEVEPMTPEYKAAQLVEEMGLSKAKKFVADWSKNPTPDQVDFVKGVQNSLLGITKKSDVKNLGTGNLYKVDIPDEYIPNMLDWDKPLVQQTPQVRKALESLGIKTDEQMLNEFDDALLKSLFGDKDIPLPKQPMNPSGSDIYQTILRGTPESRSAKLKELGITGIRYLDEGSRKSGKGTSNFVVFDPSDVKILEQNSKPLSRKQIIKQELEKVSK
jgi:hypothetical protein